MQHRPLKKFGQNFLTQPSIAHKIVEALNITENDSILEIGPGTGVLTELILEKNPQIFNAIEIDRNLAQHLRDKFSNRVQIINDDILNFDLSSINTLDHSLKVIGNIPYNITSPIVFKLLEVQSRIESSVLMVQKEVAKRIVAKPGSKDFGILSIMVQILSKVEYLFDVDNKNFTPVPKVDSAVLKLNYFSALDNIENLDLFKRIVRGVFNHRRKMLRNTLSRIFDQTIVNSLSSFDLTRRPEQLSIEEFKELANKVNQLLGQSA